MQQHNRILAVDDNPTNIAILEELLSDNYELATAASGEEALEIAATFRPDLVLLDIMMPGIDGYETCQKMRADPILHGTKIVMVSAKAMTSERLKGYAAGADDYVTKPFDAAELLAKVQVYLRLKTVEEVDRLKTDVLSLLSHETNTPLHGLLLSAGMLLEDDVSPEEQKDCAEAIRHSVIQLHSLFEKVLKLSALKAQTVEWKLSEGNLCDVVQEAICEQAPLAEKRGVRIEEHFSDTDNISFDHTQLREVVKILLDNAIQLSPANGDIQVEVKREGESLVLSVTDHGEGIGPDSLPHIFEEFHPGDIRHHSGGHGLSLAIARHILQAHHGTIAVTSKPGVSTTFTVSLPVTTAGETAVGEMHQQEA